MSGMSFLAQPETAARDRVGLFFVSAVLSVVLLYRHWPASPFWMPAALAGIALAIWHGAYDLVIARRLLQPVYADRWRLPFAVSYVSLAALVLMAWRVFPVSALVAFLLYSGLHFGTETTTERRFTPVASAAAFGFLPIAAACCWQARSVVPLFTVMLRGKAGDAETIAAVAGAALLPCIVLSLAPVMRDRREAVRRCLLLVSQLVLFRFCPPVLAFAVFFCLLHTPEHLVETSRTATNRFRAYRMWNNLREGLGPWLVSLAAIVCAGWMGRRTAQAYTGLLFVALSALTVPHMVLAMLATPGAHRVRSTRSGTTRGAVQL